MGRKVRLCKWCETGPCIKDKGLCKSCLKLYQRKLYCRRRARELIEQGEIQRASRLLKKIEQEIPQKILQRIPQKIGRKEKRRRRRGGRAKYPIFYRRYHNLEEAGMLREAYRKVLRRIRSEIRILEESGLDEECPCIVADIILGKKIHRD